MTTTDRIFDYCPPMTAEGLATTDPNYRLALFNQIVDIAVTAAASVTDLLVLADTNTWDGTSTYPDLTKGGVWVILEADGADAYYRCRPDNTSSMSATSQGEKIPNGDQVRFKFTTAMRYLEVIASGSGNVKKRFSCTPSPGI